MKKAGMFFLALTALALSAWASPIQHGRNFGLGLVAGEPSGLSWKYWQGSANAYDGSVAWSFFEAGYFRANAGCLWHNFRAIEVEQGRMQVYYGIGATLWDGHFRDHHGTNVGVRGVVSQEYILQVLRSTYSWSWPRPWTSSRPPGFGSRADWEPGISSDIKNV